MIMILNIWISILGLRMKLNPNFGDKVFNMVVQMT